MNSTATREEVRVGLHSGQRQVWSSPARFKAVVAGRRWGKTLLSRAWLLSKALSGQPGRYWYVAPTRDDAKDIMWADLKRSCHPDWLAGSPRENELALNLITGAEVRLWSAEKGETLRGRALRALVLDEYAIMPADLFSEILRPSLADYQAPALFIGTPKSFNHFHDFYLRGQSADPRWSDWHSWQFSSADNPTAAVQQEAKEARHELDERTYRQEWEASFETVAGRAYYAFDRPGNVAPVRLERHDPVCLSFDFNVEPSTAIIGQKQGDRACVWRDVQLSHRGGEATKACAMRVRELLAEAGHTGEIRIYGDATGRSAKTTGPSDHAILRQFFPQGVWTIARHNPHERDRVAAVNAMCATTDGRRRLRVDPSCVALVTDLEQVIYAANGEIDKRSNPMLTHVSDALGYWLEQDFPTVSRGYVASVQAPRDENIPSAVLASRARRRKAIADSLGIEA